MTWYQLAGAESEPLVPVGGVPVDHRRQPTNYHWTLDLPTHVLLTLTSQLSQPHWSSPAAMPDTGSAHVTKIR